ncbi:unnamed protein product [Calypogeia fissa]
MIGRRDPGLGAGFLNRKLHLHKLNTFSHMRTWTSILSTTLMVIAAKAGVTDPVCSLSDHSLLQLAPLTASDAPTIRKRQRKDLNANPGFPPCCKIGFSKQGSHLTVSYLRSSRDNFLV